MPTPERGPGGPEQHPRREQEPAAYQRAVRFAGEQPAGRAYVAAQRVIYEAPQPVDVSVFRLQLNQLWHVVALGLAPPAPVLKALEEVLATGEPANLPQEVWQALADRRAQQIQYGPWVQRHHRPGRRL